MFIIKNKKIYIAISATLVGLSLLAGVIFGFNLGIDFTGGTILEITYHEHSEQSEQSANLEHNTTTISAIDSAVDSAIDSLESSANEASSAKKIPTTSEVSAVINTFNLGGFTLQPTGKNGYIMRMRELNDNEGNLLLTALTFNDTAQFTTERQNTVGPIVGDELKHKAVIAILLVMAGIIFFVAYAFRHVSKPVSSWKFGLVAVITLIHDVSIPTGIFVLIGKFWGVEIDILFVTAMLAIVGYSVNDTIVVFDRIREKLKFNKDLNIKQPFDITVGESLQQTFVRSINTSFTTLIVLTALFLLGGESTKYFSLALLMGVIFGTYSSIFLASPLLALVESMQKNND